MSKNVISKSQTNFKLKVAAQFLLTFNLLDSLDNAVCYLYRGNYKKEQNLHAWYIQKIKNKNLCLIAFEPSKLQTSCPMTRVD